MKNFFNIIRNISFIFVLFLIAMLIYLANNPELRTGFRDYFCVTNEVLAQDSVRMDRVEEYSADKEEYFTTDTSESYQMQEVRERLPELKEEGKYKIPVKGGFAYLQATQVMYARSKKGSPVELTTTSQDTLKLNVNLTELGGVLDKSDEACFFRIKSAIINCNYVIQLAKESTKIGENYSYQYVVTMQNGDRINVSEEMANDFFEILEYLAI